MCADRAATMCKVSQLVGLGVTDTDASGSIVEQKGGLGAMVPIVRGLAPTERTANKPWRTSPTAA